jgi:hypothetical protein
MSPMSTRVPIAALSLVLLASETLGDVAVARAQSPKTVAASKAPYNIDVVRDQLYDAYNSERRAIQDAAIQRHISAADATRQINDANTQRFAAARKAATRVESEMQAILDDARRIREEQIAAYSKRTGGAAKGAAVGNMRNTGTSLSDPASRGVLGDTDGTAALEADRAAVVEAATRRGYNVSGRLHEGYVKIEELDWVLHGPTDVPRNPLDPQVRLGTHARAQGHESFAARGSRQPYLHEGTAEWSGRDSLGAVADNIKKVEAQLRTHPATLEGRDIENWAQNLAKGAGRAMDAAGKTEGALQRALDGAKTAGDTARAAQLSADLDLRRQLARLKTEMDPLATGLVSPTAEGPEVAAALRKFQQRCLEQFSDAYRAGVANNRRLIDEMNVEIGNLLRVGKEAEASARIAERAAIIDGAAQSVQYLATAKDGGKLLAEVARGQRLTPTTRLGQAGYLDPAGNFVSEAEVRAVGESVLNDARARLTRGGEGPGRASAGMTKFERGMIYLQAMYSGYAGAQKELEDARAQGRPPSNLKAVLKAWLEMSGAPGAHEIGKSAAELSIQEELDRLEKAIERGEDPNIHLLGLWAYIKGVSRTALRLTGVSSIWEGGDEFRKLVFAAYDEMQGPPGDVNSIIRDRAPQFVDAAARDLANSLTMLRRLDTLGLQARAALAAVNTPLTALDRLHAEAQALKTQASGVNDMCRANANRATEIAALQTQASAVFAEVEARATDARRLSDPVCQGLATSGTATPPASWPDAQNAHERMNRLMNDATAAQHRAASLLDDFEKDATRVQAAKRTTIDTKMNAMPDMVEALRAAIEQATEPVFQLGALSSALQEQATALKRQANMLVDAHAEEDRAFGFIAEADRILERITTADASGLAERVMSLAARAIGESEYATDEMKTTKDAWQSACPVSSSAPSLANLDAQAARVNDAVNAALTTYARAHDCVVHAERNAPTGGKPAADPGTASPHAAADAAAKAKADADRVALAQRIAGWQKGLACLEEGARKFPKYWQDCNGNWTMGSRDVAIENLRRLIREAQANVAKLTPAPAATADAVQAPAAGMTPAPTRSAGPLETSVNRQGSDYRAFTLPIASSALCLHACLADSKCQAFTFVAPAQGTAATCRLKDGVPSAAADTCCTSGVVQIGRR